MLRRKKTLFITLNFCTGTTFEMVGYVVSM